jgi:uncharacterized membrane protein YdfJ with MMPL/SSD domain
MSHRLSEASEVYARPPHAYELEGPAWFTAYFNFVERRGKFIIAFWVVAYVFGLLVGPEFLKMGDDSVRAPKHTRSHPAQQEFEARFVMQSHELPLMVLVSSLEDVRTPAMSKFSKELSADVRAYNGSVGNVLSMFSYYDMQGTLLDGAKGEFMSADNKATFINIMVRGDFISADRYKFVRHLKQAMGRLNPDPHVYTMGLTGFDAMASDSADTMAREVMRIDIFTMPFALALLGFMIKSWRLLLFSCFNLGVAILFSFSIMATAVKLGAPHPESASAQLMEVMTMAVSIDWSLFLQRRFRDEVKKGSSVRHAAYSSLLHSGHVVVMSGATLIIVFLGFTVMPAATVQMDGACCATGVTVAMAVALTNTAALWLTFPNFCGDFNPRCCKSTTIQDLEREAALLHEANSMTAPLVDFEQEDAPPTHVMYDGPRFKFTRWVTRFPNNILSIVALYLLVIPLAVVVKDMVINQNVLSSMPRSSPAAQTYKKAFEYFPGGTFAPIYVLVTSKSRDASKAVLAPAFFQAAADVADKVAVASKHHDVRFNDMSVTGPPFLAGRKVSLAEALALLHTAKSVECNVKHVSGLVRPACSAAKEYELEWTQSVNEKQNAMLVNIVVVGLGPRRCIGSSPPPPLAPRLQPFFPFAQESSAYIDLVYKVLDQAILDHPDYDFYFCGFEVGFNALMHRVFGMFPQLIGGTFLIVFVVLGFLLRSAFVPVRLVLTLVAPLAAVFGMGTLVYQDGALEWTGLAAFDRMDGFFWYIPILLLSMIIGLALDWDVLLISRIMEHRQRGYDIRAAICKATCETGGTISAAGVIMCLAFAGMLFSDQSTINACGFILTVALILDTFVVNTVLVPALISLGDKVAWYPAQMPMHNLKTLSGCGEFPIKEGEVE